MITSPQNEKLKLIRKLSERKHRERESLFATEGEDLLAAGLAAGRDPLFALVAPESGIDGEEVEADLLDGVSTLGSGTRAIAVWPQAWVEPGPGPCAYLYGVADPGNVGAIVRTVDALAGRDGRARAGLRGSALAEGRARQHGLDLRGRALRGPPSARRRRRALL